MTLTDSIFFLTSPLAMLRVFNLCLDANFIVCHGQGINSKSQNNAVAREIAPIIQTGLRSSSSNCYDWLSLTGVGHSHSLKLGSTSLTAWFPANRREFMNVVSKGCLQSLFSGNRRRVGNGQRSSTGLGLVDWRPKNLSDKACWNLLGAEDIRQIKAKLSTKQDDNADTRRDNKAGIKKDNKAGIRGDNKAAIRKKGDEADMKGRDDKVGIGR